MLAADLSLLDCATLVDRLHQLAGEERGVQVDFLLHLDELDRRRSFVELGYPSLWAFCQRVLHLREGPAGRRIGAMRVLRRFPKLAAQLRDGRLCFSASAIRCAIETHGKRRGAVKPAGTRRPTTPATATSPRAISAEVRRQVWGRDGGCCTFTSPDGTRCGSHWKLELDHVQPVALGGASTADNLRIRWRAHNFCMPRTYSGAT